MDEPDFHRLLVNFKPNTKNESLSSEAQQFYTQLMKKIHPKDQAERSDIIEALTAKEIEIVSLLSEGLPNKLIAEKLLVSLGTLKWHLHNIYSKLQVKNRTQALLEAKRLGYI